MEQMTANEGYDFTDKDPRVALRQDEIDNFDEGMRLKNKSIPANEVGFGEAALDVASDFDRLFS